MNKVNEAKIILEIGKNKTVWETLLFLENRYNHSVIYSTLFPFLAQPLLRDMMIVYLIVK